MVDNSDDYDDGPIYLSDANDDAPFDIGDVVALDPRYFDEDDPALDGEGEVVELEPSGRGWEVLVAWYDGERTWTPANQLVDGD